MINQSLLLAGDDQYQIARSLRFNSADSAYLNRTPAGAGNQKTWTFSAWIKRGTLGSSLRTTFLDGGSTGPLCDVEIYGDQLRLYVTDAGITTSEIPVTTAVFRDPSAWYHIVFVIDTTQATTANRVKIYVNNVLQTITGLTGTLITQNANLGINRAVATYIGYYSYGSSANFSGYITEVNFIDGQALTPSSFGETDAATGVWKPKKYTGTYGTNGFYLNFSDNSGTTSTTLGKDSSGNGNNWTPNNFSVTAGAGNDSLVDTPTPYGTDTGAGGEVRGNYATLNSVLQGQTGTLSNGNLQLAGTGASAARSTIAIPSSGLFYIEATADTSSASGLGMAFGLYAPSVASNLSYISGVANTWGIYSDSAGVIGRNGTNTTGITIITSGVTYQLAVDLANGRAWLGVNNVWFNGTSGTTGNPSTGANPTFTSLPSELLVGLWSDNTKNWTINFGQRPFAYTAPSGYKALCTQNLPTPTIGATSSTQANKYFDATLYTGTSASQSVTNAGAFQPDLVWIKSRSAATDHKLTDAVRGATKGLISDTTGAETTDTNGLTAFNSNGFTVGSDSNYNNGTGPATYVGWQWNAGGSNATNTAGSITSTVRANASAGFSIVTYTGTGANATVGHGLGVAPKMIIIKQRTASSTTNWIVWHTSTAGYSWYLKLNLTDAQNGDTTVFQAAASSTTFSIGSNSAVNANSGTYVAYCFSEVAGYSRFGSYTGNGSADGVFVYTGFRPAFVLTKCSSTTGDWRMYDYQRPGYNVIGGTLLADTSGAETTSAEIDFLSNGFKLRTTTDPNSAQTFVYAAFAANPFKYSLAR